MEIIFCPNSVSCPMGAAWRRWTLRDFVHGTLDPDAAARITAAADAYVVVTERVRDVAWETAFDYNRRRDGDIGLDSHLQAAGHVHVSFELAGHHAHVDCVHANRGGPGLAFMEIRIFVDGELAGRGGTMGCSLGVSSNSLPAVALVGDRHGLVVSGDTAGPPRIERCARWQNHDFSEGERARFALRYQTNPKRLARAIADFRRGSKG